MRWWWSSRRFLFFAASCGFLASLAYSPRQLHAQMATEDRLLYRGWWPRHSIPSPNDYVGPAECAKCHGGKAATQQATPMARTSVPVADSDVLAARGLLNFQAGRLAYQIKTAGNSAVYTISDGTHTLSAPVNWAFGDGHIGQSYLFERDGNFYESRVSYFSTLNSLDFTPGRKPNDSQDLLQTMGRPVVGTELVRCFACHATASTINEKFDRTRIIAGITCEACHGPGLGHALAERTEQVPGSIFSPSHLNPADSVDFCGACHSTWWDVKQAGLAGIDNVRAQPYRLEKSRCWGMKGDARLTCVACHDPHQKLVRDSESYDKNCLSCHTTAASGKLATDHAGSDHAGSDHAAPACTVGTKNCSSCHMPKYEDTGMHYTFTDHDIRVVKPGAPYPD